jgi:hypothetical protein
MLPSMVGTMYRAPITVGFTRNRHILALVQKKTYVECTEYVRRHTPATTSSRQPQTTNKRTMAVSSGFWYYDI